MKLNLYLRLARLDKPVGIYLLLWPTLTALWLAAEGTPDFKLIVIFVLGVILARSAGCIINDYADIEFDIHVARTKERVFAKKLISKKEALTLFATLLSIAFILVLQINWLTIVLSLIAALLMCIYPFMKRFTDAPQLFLGLAFSWAVPMAFAAQLNIINPNSLWLMAYVIFWAIAYDTMYAAIDMDDDLKIGVKSTAILFHPYQSLWIGGAQIMLLVCLLMVGVKFNLNNWYYLGLAIAGGHIIYHQLLLRYGNREKYFQAFLHNHWLGFTVFIGTVLSFALS